MSDHSCNPGKKGTNMVEYVTSPMSPAFGRQSLIDDESTPTKMEKGEHTEPKQGCSVMMMIIIALPMIAQQMAWAAQWAAVGPWINSMVPSWSLQLLQGWGPVSGFIVSPLVGAMSDNCTSKLGRRRPYLLFGAFSSAICWMIMAFTKEIGEALGDSGNHRPATTAVMIICYIWMDITVNLIQTPAKCLMADFAGDRQVLGASIGQGMCTLGALFVSLYIALFGPAYQTIVAFMAFLSGVMIVTNLMVLFFVKEEQLAKPQLSVGEQTKETFRTLNHAIRTMPRELALFAIAFGCVMFGYTSYGGARGQFFGLVVLGGDSLGADICDNDCTHAQNQYNRGVQMAGGAIDTAFNIVGYLFTWIIPFIVRALGSKKTLMIMTIPQVLLIALSMCKVLTIDIVIVVLCSLTQQTYFGLLVAYVLNSMGGKEADAVNDSRMGTYIGATSSASCVGQFLNFFLSFIIVNTSWGYALPVLVGGAVSAIGLIVVAFFSKLNFHNLQ